MKILATLGDSLIVGINGRLAIVDPPFRCHGKQYGCTCPECTPWLEDQRQKQRYLMGQKACIGFTSRCQCPRCLDRYRYLRRQRTAIEAQKAPKCQCGGQALVDRDYCHKCGRQVSRAA